MASCPPRTTLTDNYCDCECVAGEGGVSTCPGMSPSSCMGGRSDTGGAHELTEYVHGSGCGPQGGMGRVWFEFTTQLADIDVQVMRLSSIAGSPYLREQHLASNNFTTVLDESLE